MGKRVPDEVAADEMRQRGGVTPLEPYPGSTRQWRCWCPTCEREVTPRLMSIRKGHAGCRFCSRPRGAANWRGIDPAEAERIMRESGGVEPLEPYPGSQSPWRCWCEACKVEVKPSLHSVRQGRHGCTHCAARWKGERQRLSDAEAVRRMVEIGNAIPDEPYPGSVDKSWRCICGQCGAPITPTLGNVMRNYGACRFCGVKARATSQMKSDDEARAVMIARGVIPNPDTPYPGNHRPWKSTCGACGSPIAPRFSTVQRGEGACRYCAEYGYKWTEPAVLYALAHDDWSALKVGVTGTETDRLEHFQRKGWRVVDQHAFPTGEAAKGVERRILAALVMRGIRLGFVSKHRMGARGGSSETFAAKEISQRALVRLVRREVRHGGNG